MQSGLRVKNQRGKQSQGTSQYCEFYHQDLDQIPTVKIRDKSLWDSDKEKGKETIWKYDRKLRYS